MLLLDPGPRTHNKHTLSPSSPSSLEASKTKKALENKTEGMEGPIIPSTLDTADAARRKAVVTEASSLPEFFSSFFLFKTTWKKISLKSRGRVSRSCKARLSGPLTWGIGARGDWAKTGKGREESRKQLAGG